MVPPSSSTSRSPVWRVRDRASFAALRARRRSRRGPLVLTCLPAASSPTARPGDPPRVAYAVGRAVGNAVARNRLRRRLRHAVREHAGALEPGSTYLVGADRAAAALPYGRLRDELGALLAETHRAREGAA